MSSRILGITYSENYNFLNYMNPHIYIKNYALHLHPNFIPHLQSTPLNAPSHKFPNWMLDLGRVDRSRVARFGHLRLRHPIRSLWRG